MVRVIAGICRGRKLKTVDSEATKPTLDRVKEAMFSMIMDRIPGANVFDLFAGNGSLGIEALSRGAARCFFSDISTDCCKIIRENLAATGLGEKGEVTRGDFHEAAEKIAAGHWRVNLLLLDPPYRQGLIEKALTDPAVERICARPNGDEFPARKTLAVCEHAGEEELPEKCGGFSRIKTKRYGTVGVSLYEFTGD